MGYILYVILFLALAWGLGTRMRKPDAWTFNFLYLVSIIWWWFIILILTGR